MLWLTAALSHRRSCIEQWPNYCLGTEFLSESRQNIYGCHPAILFYTRASLRCCAGIFVKYYLGKVLNQVCKHLSQVCKQRHSKRSILASEHLVCVLSLVCCRTVRAQQAILRMLFGRGEGSCRKVWYGTGDSGPSHHST